jgi:hypothetical protein
MRTLLLFCLFIFEAIVKLLRFGLLLVGGLLVLLMGATYVRFHNWRRERAFNRLLKGL